MFIKEEKKPLENTPQIIENICSAKPHINTEMARQAEQPEYPLVSRRSVHKWRKK